MITIGIDIGSEKFDVMILADGEANEVMTFDNKRKGYQAFHRYLRTNKLKAAHLCMEATGRYGEQLCEFLYEKAYRVSVVNPARIKAYAQSKLQRNKTDQLDAALIADFCLTQNPPLWAPPPPHWRELQVLIRHLATLEEELQRHKNRLHALERAVSPAKLALKQLRQQIKMTQKLIEEVKQEIQDHIDKHPDLKEKQDLMVSIKGVGKLTAAKLLAEFGDMSQFSDVREVVAFAGLNPRHHQSGKSVKGKTSISKMGRSSIRAALYMPAISAKRSNPIMQAFAARLDERGKSGKEVIVAIMRKLLHLVYGILKSGQPFDPNYLKKMAV